MDWGMGVAGSKQAKATREEQERKGEAGRTAFVFVER
jgi:hypothetical protein